MGTIEIRKNTVHLDGPKSLGKHNNPKGVSILNSLKNLDNL